MLQWKTKVQSAKMWKGHNFKYGVREKTSLRRCDLSKDLRDLSVTAIGDSLAGKVRVPGKWKSPEVGVCMFENSRKVRWLKGESRGEKQEVKPKKEGGWRRAGALLQGLELSLSEMGSPWGVWAEQWHDLTSILKAEQAEGEQNWDRNTT